MQQKGHQQAGFAPITIIIIVVALIFLGFVGIKGLKIFLGLDTPRIGSAGKYISLTECGEVSRYVIDKRRIPKYQINSCTEETNVVDAEPVTIVDIAYGPGQDCESGCIYKYFSGVVSSNKSSIQELPSKAEIYTSIWGREPLNIWRDKQGFRCPQSLENVTHTELTKQRGTFGWRLVFDQPYECNWPIYNKSNNSLDYHQSSLSGSIFVYKQFGIDQWDTKQLVTTD